MSYLVTFREYDDLFDVFMPVQQVVSANDLNSFLKDLEANKWSEEGDEMITAVKVFALVDMKYEARVASQKESR